MVPDQTIQKMKGESFWLLFKDQAINNKIKLNVRHAYTTDRGTGAMVSMTVGDHGLICDTRLRIAAGGKQPTKAVAKYNFIGFQVLWVEGHSNIDIIDSHWDGIYS